MAFLSQNVFAQRCEAMRALMEREQLEALLFFTPDYCFYASNFEVDVLTWERPVLVAITRDGPPFAVFHELSRNHVVAARERETLWVDEIAFYSELPHQQRIPLVTELPSVVARLLAERGLSTSRVGVDASPALLADVCSVLPDLAAVSLVQELRGLRLVKASEELDLARQAASLSDLAQTRYREEIAAGCLVEQLDWGIGAQVMEEAATRWPGESVKLRLLSLSGAESASPHGPGANAGMRIESGDVLVNIVIVRLNGVTIENERTWLIGEVTHEHERAFQAALDAQDAATRRMVVGEPVSAGHRAAMEVFAARGYEPLVCHRTGHGMGIGHGGAITAHDFPHDTAFEDRPLLAGELYSVEPGIYLPGVGGFRHDDSVVVGDEPEVLTHAPRDLESQRIRV